MFGNKNDLCKPNEIEKKQYFMFLNNLFKKKNVEASKQGRKLVMFENHCLFA